MSGLAQAGGGLAGLEAQNAVLRQAIQVCDRLADACLQGTDVGMLVSLAADFLGRPVVILDPALRTRAAAWPGASDGASRAEDAGAASGNPLGWQMTDARVERLLSTLCDSRRPMRVPSLPGWGARGGTVVAPIAVGDLLLGYLAMLSGDPPGEASAIDEVELLTISHLSTIYALALTRERREQGGASGPRAEVLAALLAGTLEDPQSAAERAASVGLPVAGPLRLLVARPLAPSEAGPAAGERESRSAVSALRSHVLDELATRLEALVEGAVAVARPDEVVAVAPEPPFPSRRQVRSSLGEQLAQGLDRLGLPPGLSVGVSSRCPSLLELARTYRQTRLALELAGRIGHGHPMVECDRLGAYRLLLRLGDPADLRSFATDVLGPLIAYDQRHRAELLRTLATFLDHHGRALPAARALFVHVNTVSYRLRRIEALSGLHLSEPDDRLVAHVALKIMTGLGPSPGGEPPGWETSQEMGGRSKAAPGEFGAFLQ
jgi:hypothetical protein